MKLAAYLEITKTTDQDFGRRIGRNRSTVSRIRREVIKPDWETVSKIQHETGGAVTANDFVDAHPSNGESAQ